MAAIDKLLEQVSDASLRERLKEEIEHLTQNKKFGLVFEEHLPECTPLYGVPIKRGATVAKKASKINDTYTVIKLNKESAICRNKKSGETEEIATDELVSVSEFGEPIFPCLTPIDRVENAPDSNLWHTLIQADNYHALQLLEYLYAGKVDCIYIDPPYNTGAKDWKYNNDYVDGSDSYRHSKWLSFIQRRLKLAKRLLNPDDSVLIVTIDEKEYLHLGCLLEEMFPEANIQMVSSVINHASVARFNEFNRNNEYIFFVMQGCYELESIDDSKTATEGTEVAWNTLRRHSPSNIRTSRPRQFYPIYINVTTHVIEAIGDPIAPNVNRNSVVQREGCVAVFPVRDNGIEMLWGVVPEELRRRLKGGYVRVGKYEPEKPQQFSIQVLPSGPIAQIENGELEVDGYRDDGSVIVYHKETKKVLPKSQWDYASHDAKTYGSNILKSTFPDARFSYPKSVYAVKDAMTLFVGSKSNALVLDFFAGSGTTLHAVNLLNAEDGGHRRCIMVTNNEVSAEEARNLTAQGYKPGDEEWEKLGIARYVTWPRTVCSIEGHDVNGNPLTGNYGCEQEEYTEVEGDVTDPETGRKIRGKVYKKTKKPAYPKLAEIKMSDGFAANCEYFKLDFLDRDMVSLGTQFQEILPLLWLKAGAVGKRPEVTDEEPRMLVLPQNRFAVLVEEAYFAEFARQVEECGDIDTVYFVTNSEQAFREMSAGINVENTHQLYREYIDNFVIGARRDAK